jgi:hypothetical protein
LMLAHARTERSKIIDKVARVHAIANRLRAPVSTVDDIWRNGRKLRLVKRIVNGLLRLSPDVLLHQRQSALTSGSQGLP